MARKMVRSGTSSRGTTTRVQHMIEKKSEFSTEVETRIDASTLHWSEVDSSMPQTKHSGKTNREYFEVLKSRRYMRHGDHIVFQQIPENDEEISEILLIRGLVASEKHAGVYIPFTIKGGDVVESQEVVGHICVCDVKASGRFADSNGSADHAAFLQPKPFLHSQARASSHETNS